MSVKPVLSLALLLVLTCAGAGAVLAQNATPTAAPAAPEGSEQIVFHHVLDNSVIEFTYKPDQQITDAVANFHKTATNPYDGNAEAIAAGKETYNSLCAACHLKDGSGRIGPNLVDDEWRYPQVAKDKGMFEIIYAGGAGAMQAFGRRITQDEILKVMAYVHSLRGK